MPETPDRIAFTIEPAVKKKFVELCDERGSNMSVELKRFIYNELKKEDK